LTFRRQFIPFRYENGAFDGVAIAPGDAGRHPGGGGGQCFRLGKSGL
jgi:hypothetical protein